MPRITEKPFHSCEFHSILLSLSLVLYTLFSLLLHLVISICLSFSLSLFLFVYYMHKSRLINEAILMCMHTFFVTLTQSLYTLSHTTTNIFRLLVCLHRSIVIFRACLQFVSFAHRSLAPHTTRPTKRVYCLINVDKCN